MTGKRYTTSKEAERVAIRLSKTAKQTVDVFCEQEIVRWFCKGERGVG
jgi:hypothetical protein